MDIFDYDYYGNDKESNNFSFSVQEIHKQQRDKERKRSLSLKYFFSIDSWKGA